MIRVVEERDDYVLLSEGERFAVMERRAGRLYPLVDGDRPGIAPDDQTALRDAIGPRGWGDEEAARRQLLELAERHDRLARRLW